MTGRLVGPLPDPERSRAVLIGTAQYRHMPDLPAVANNLYALQRIITDTALFGLPSDHCAVILDAVTPGEVLAPVRQAARDAEDTLIVYFAGHGHQEEEDFHLYLGLHESHPDSPENSLAYPMLRSAVARTRARRRVIILDSCFSGLAMGAMAGADAVDPAAVLAGQAAVAGAYLMCSASRTALALAEPGETYTAFTGELVDVLNWGVDDGPEYITLDDAFRHVRSRLVAKSRPRPRKQALDDIGGLALVRNQRMARHRRAEPRRYEEDPRPLRLSERYELGTVLGRGGTAEVYVARDIRLGRAVAVKALRSDLARDPFFQNRFRREAQSAAALNHPAIVAIHDTGEDLVDGVSVPYIVMEYVDGRTLRDVLDAEHMLPPERALKLTRGILRALEHAHASGIVHCDIKPRNILVTRDDQIKVMDFGIARGVTDPASASAQGATVIGTAQYLSPEQALGEPVDARSDIYSTGCLLYELLTARPPFTGESPVAVAYRRVQEEPQPPSAHAPGLPPELDSVVMRALARTVDHRYPSAADMRDAVQRTLESLARRRQGGDVGATVSQEREQSRTRRTSATRTSSPGRPPSGTRRASAAGRTEQVVVGDLLLTVNWEDNSAVAPYRPGEHFTPPAKRTAAERVETEAGARPPALAGPPPPTLPLLGRDIERERLVRLLARGRTVWMTAGAGSGRTTLLDRVAEDCAGLAPDGVVRLTGFRRTADDLLYDLYHAVHNAPRYQPSRSDLLARVAEIGAVVVLDDLGFGGAALDELLRATPECAFLIAASPEVQQSSGFHLDESVLSGLDRGDSLHLLQVVVGRALAAEEVSWAEDILSASRGLPLPLVQAGALLRQGGLAGAAFGTSEEAVSEAGRSCGPTPLLVSRLSDVARATLRLALLLDGEVPHQAHLPALVGETHADAATGELVACGLISPVGSRYRLAAGVLDQLEDSGYAADAQADASNIVQHYVWWARHPSVSPDRVCHEADSVLAALDLAMRLPGHPGEGENNAAVQLARATAPAFASGLHWSAWQRALLGGVRASATAGADALQAYFRHELVILACCFGQPDLARTEWDAATALRRTPSDGGGDVADHRAFVPTTPMPTE
ncbi:protein kinase [Streptomyces sp. NPDC006458]|uniref:caspase, EACC1-associated type n=1 Tax=Streptomyces sp. NPDC006458 TaxID=3154302 RepID=UPI0033BD4FE7